MLPRYLCARDFQEIEKKARFLLNSGVDIEIIGNYYTHKKTADEYCTTFMKHCHPKPECEISCRRLHDILQEEKLKREMKKNAAINF
jgi:hypothetical protein